MSEKDYRTGQRVICTLEVEDKGQDFIEIDLLENNVILGDSVIFKNGRLSMIGLGTSDGVNYWSVDQLKEDMELVCQCVILADEPVLIYFKATERPDPFPWEATTLKYAVVGVKKATKPNRFIKK